MKSIHNSATVCISKPQIWQAKNYYLKYKGTVLSVDDKLHSSMPEQSVPQPSEETLRKIMQVCVYIYIYSVYVSINM